MEDIHDNNKIAEGNERADDTEFKFNFINTPWDERSRSSKIRVITLLVAIFTAMLACVVGNFLMHYRGFDNNHILSYEIKCHLVKMEEYRYVARIHLVSTQELLCVGAVVSTSSVLAIGVCVKSGPIRLRLGSITDPRCKKGFPVDIIEPIYHDGVISKTLVLLSSYEKIADCVSIIRIGNKLDVNSEAYILGRPFRVEKSLSRQPATITEANSSFVKLSSIKRLNKKNMIFVKGLARCPVRAGDLLVQNGLLFGVASTSVHREDQSKMASFADLKFVLQGLKELDSNIDITGNDSHTAIL